MKQKKVEAVNSCDKVAVVGKRQLGQKAAETKGSWDRLRLIQKSEGLR